MAISTLCRQCGVHLKIEKGVAIAPPKPPEPKINALPASRSPQQKSDPAKKKFVKPKPPPPPPKPEKPAKKTAASIDNLAPSRYQPPPPGDKPKESVVPPLPDLLKFREKKRVVRCFECAHEHEILADSTSALCPRCGSYIGLRDYDIREKTNTRIQTRGSVFVHKKGSVVGVLIQCHHLTIEGEIHGGAECSGDFIIRKTGKIKGPVSCTKLVVERRAEIDFMSTVKAEEVSIDGHVTGNIVCKKLILKKRATLTGDLEVATLSVEEGARHSGKITMVTG